MSYAETAIAGQESPCGLCEYVIEKGELIVYVDDEWCHVACAEEYGE